MEASSVSAGTMKRVIFRMGQACGFLFACRVDGLCPLVLANGQFIFGGIHMRRQIMKAMTLLLAFCTAILGWAMAETQEAPVVYVTISAEGALALVR